MIKVTESIKEILTHFSIELNPSSYGNGHINDTYLVATDPSYILQKINKNVFKKPEEVMENIKLVTEHLRRKIIAEGGDPMREPLSLIETVDGKPFYKSSDGEYYRMYVFIDGARSYDVVESPEQLYQAAKAFGRFQNMLADFPAEKLYEVIPRFHDTRKRYADFLAAVEADSVGRAAGAAREIQFVKDREDAVGVVVDDIASGILPVRVTHNDTKLNNVLLDEKTGEGVCVIDLDTVMPGSLLYDFGDALRFAGSTGAEDEPDLDKIWFDLANFEAFTRGFVETLPSITERELELLPFSVKLLTLECGMRFLADYLSGDTYFKTAYPEHNLIRCRTQFKLIEDMERKMGEMESIVKKIAG